VTDRQSFSTNNKRIDFSIQSIIRVIFTIGMILASAAILFFLVYRQREILVQHEWRFEPVPILLSFLIYCIALFLVVVIWASIMDSVGASIPVIRHFHYYSISNLAKRIPGTIWYIASRAQFYRAEDVPALYTSLASGVELLIATIAGILVSLFFAVQIIEIYELNLIWFVLALLFGMVSIHPRILDWLLRRLGADTSHFSYANLLKWLIGYILVWILGGVILFFIGNIITTIEIRYIAYIIGSWALVGVLTTVLFFSPSNLGFTEVGLSLLLSNIIPSPIAVIIAIAARIIFILYEVLWAIVNTIIVDRSKRVD
jgi:glycosyltransferase 2 family protein